MHNQQLVPQVHISSNESGIYTYDDILRRHMGEENQIYDAFVLFAEEDTQFALEMTERMEREGEFKAR
jgi:myeloid differentiation primary response protein MyD88